MQPKPSIQTSPRPSFPAKRWLAYGGLLSMGLVLSLPLSAQGRTFGELFQVPAYERNNLLQGSGGEFFMQPSSERTSCDTLNRTGTPISQDIEPNMAAQRRLYRFGPGAENFPGQPRAAIAPAPNAQTSGASSTTANSSLGNASGMSSSIQSQTTNSGINGSPGMIGNQAQASAGGTIAGCQAIQ